MKRSPASVVVVAQRGPEGRSRVDFLARTLKPALGIRDELVVVADGEPAARYLPPSLGVSDARDLAARRLAGARVAKHEVLVLVCADCVPPAHPVDPLVAALDNGAVAAGPMHDLGPGRQGVTPPIDALASAQGLKRWSQDWRLAHKGEAFDTHALGEGVIAVRRADLVADGGLPGLGVRLADRGRLAVVGDSVWHHRGAQGCGLAPSRTPLLSAVLIVKDEEAMLPDSLAALFPVCDEVVVYDTGSSDRTVDIARTAGARVVLGYWDDHFGDARNRALSHAFGTWHLQVDADEVLEVQDVEVFRAALAGCEAESVAITLENRTGSGMGTPHSGMMRRLARREEGWFAGRLHEQVMHRDGRGPVQVPLHGVKLVHYGYMAAISEARGKSARNLHLASLALADAVPSGLTRGTALANLARSQRFAGENEAVLETAALAQNEEFTPINLRELCHAVSTAAAALGRFEVAHEWLDRLRAAQTNPIGTYEIAAEVLLAEERWSDVLDIVAAMPVEAEDDNKRMVRQASALPFEVVALCQLGRVPEAAARIVEVTATGSMNLALERVLAVLEEVPGSVDAYASALHESMIMLTLAETRWVTPHRADGLLEAMWTAGRRRPAILAAAILVAPQLSVLRALEWSARMRSQGFGADCALVRLACDPARPARDRVVAAAVALETFGDDRGMPSLVEAAEQVPDEEAMEVSDELRMLAPGVAKSLLVA